MIATPITLIVRLGGGGYNKLNIMSENKDNYNNNLCITSKGKYNNYKGKVSFFYPVNSVENLGISRKMNSNHPRELQMIICKDSYLKALKRSKNSVTVELSIPRGITLKIRVNISKCHQRTIKENTWHRLIY